MSVIIRLQNLPWSANAMDIRTFFRGLSIPEGGVHIVGGEQGDAFIAFSTDEDARQAMMNDGGKIKEVQVKLLLSSRSEMHKVIEAARQSVSFMQIAAPVIPIQQQPVLPASITGLLAQNVKLPNNLQSNFSIPKIDQSSVTSVEVISDSEKDRDSKRGRDSKNNDRKSTRSRSRSRDRDKKDRGRDRKDKRSRSRDRSRDRDRRRRDRSRSRDRRDRRRDRKDRSRDRDRSKESNDSRMRKDDKKMDVHNDGYNDKIQQQPHPYPQNFNKEGILGAYPHNNFRMDNANRPLMPLIRPPFGNPRMNQNSNWSSEPNVAGPMNHMNIRPNLLNGPNMPRYDDSNQLHRLQELDERRNPNAFQNNDNPVMFNPRNVPKPQYQVPNQNMNENNFNPAVPFNQDPTNKREPPKGMCVKIQNLLSSTGYADIRRFFTGNFISNQGLKIINNDNGKRSGTAYVKFVRLESKQNALRKNGHILKGRTVTITSLTDEEFDNAIDSYRPNKDSEDSGDEGDSQKSLVIVENNDNDESVEEFKVLMLEDLPAFAKEHDIMKMFSDYSLLSIQVIVTKDVRKQYVAYVEFVNADDAKAALHNKSKHLIGHKIIKVSPCSDAAFEIVKVNQNILMEGGNEVNEDESQEEFDRNTTNNISRDPRQRRFDNNRSDESFNRGNIPYTNQNPRFPWRGGGNPGFDREHGLLKRPPPVMMANDYIEEKLDCTFLKGLPLRTTDTDILDFFSDVGVIPTKIHLMLTIQGQPSGDCFCEFIDTEEALTAASKHNSMLGNHTVTVELVTKQVVDEARGIIPADKGFANRGFRGGRGFVGVRGMRRMRGTPPPFHNGNRGGHRFMAPVAGSDGAFENIGADSFGIPGCVLALENVPFRAGIDEILEFFREFNLTQNNVIRRFNEKGHPTGDVRVCMRTPAEAQHAYQQLNKRCIRDRSITITIM